MAEVTDRISEYRTCLWETVLRVGLVDAIIVLERFYTSSASKCLAKQ